MYNAQCYYYFFLPEEKKVKKYLEDNYQHRTDLISPDPEIKSSENGEGKKIQGVGPKTKEGKIFCQIKYYMTLMTRKNFCFFTIFYSLFLKKECL